MRRTFLIGAGVALGVIGLSLLHFLEVAELKALDVRFYIRGAQRPTSPIVIVGIDEASFDEIYHSWAWPRELHARLLKQLAKGRPLVVGMDLLFLEPSRYGAEDDRILLQAIRETGNVVLAGSLGHEESDFFMKLRLRLPLPSLRRAASGYGVTNLPLDTDGAIRRGSLKWNFRGKGIAHFVKAVLSADRVIAHLGPSRLQGDGEFWINFRGPTKTYPTIPYYRVLNGEISPEVFRDKIVLIGPTAKSLQDLYETPFFTASLGSRAPHLWERLYHLATAPVSGGEMLPGVEVQANIAETVLRGIPLRRPPVLVHLAILLLLSLPICYLTATLRGYKAFWAYLVLAIGYMTLNLALFSALDLWLDLVSPLLSLTLVYGSISVDKYVLEERERQRTRALFGRYVTPEVVREVLDSPEGAGLGGRRRKVSVLFSDIRGFTTISEQLPPEDVISLLNDYLGRVTDIMVLHGGTLDKFIGDAVMAIFGAPIEREDDAVRAMRTALDMTRLAQELSPKWEARCGRPLRIGVGINTGEAVVGNIGSELRSQYTAIGDMVNIASRLEGLTKELGASVVVSETTYEEVKGHFRFRPSQEVFVKGRAVAITVYTLEEEPEVHDTSDTPVI